MTRIWLPVVMLAVFALLLAALAFALFGTTQPAPPNPFAEYAAYLPGQPLPDLRGCEVQDEYPHDRVYAWCYLPDSSAFRAIGLRGTWALVEGTYFYPRDMRMGEMVGWFGDYTKAKGRRGQWTMDWNRMTAYGRKGRSRFMATVFLVSYR